MDKCHRCSIRADAEAALGAPFGLSPVAPATGRFAVTGNITGKTREQDLCDGHVRDLRAAGYAVTLVTPVVFP